jgi:RimJ/RimL family protein N-acetyltransferase
MIHVIPFKKEHTLELKEFMSLLQIHDPMEYGAVLEADPLSFSGIKDGRIIGAAGIHPIHPGVGRAWALLSGEVRNAEFFLHRQVKRRLPAFIEIGDFHRVETVVRTNFPDGYFWAERLGFIHEGILKKYGPDGSDYHSFAITK